MITRPSLVKRYPLRAFLDGSTQSIMSMPRATYSGSSAGIPTPIAYRGFDRGRISAVASTLSLLNGRGSPPGKPPPPDPSPPRPRNAQAQSRREAPHIQPPPLG